MATRMSVNPVLVFGAPKVHPIVRRTLAQHASVVGFVADRIYAGSYPMEYPGSPSIRFRFPHADRFAAPTPNLWSLTGQVDCHTETEDTADNLATAVFLALLSLEGTTHEEADIIGVRVGAVQSVEDGTFAPPKPHRIVSVTLTARSNRKDGQ